MTTSGIEWFDNHCHLTSLDADPAEVVDAAAADGVTRLLTVGCTVEDSAEAIAIAVRFDRVWATAGVHPHEADDGIDGLVDLLDAEPVVAVGECGLDYFYDHSERGAQRRVFAAQIELALERDLPLVIHSREAWDDTFDVLDATGIPAHTVFHCFTGGPAEAERCLERGAVLSFSGIVTFPSGQPLRDAAAIAPHDSVMVETDSPYLAPVPHRGRRNRPALVPHVGAAIAEVWDVEPAEVARVTTATAKRFYRID